MQQCKHIMHGTFVIEMGAEHQKHYKSIELKSKGTQISILKFLPGYWKSLNNSNTAQITG